MHRVRIIDGESLKSVLREVLERTGTHRTAAKRLGIGQTTFTRLVNGTVSKSMSHDTYESIRNALEGHAIEFGLIDIFEGSVLGGHGYLVRENYEAWLEREIERLRSKGGEVFEELWEHKDYRPLFTQFLHTVANRSELPAAHEERIWLALYRAVEPLGEAQPTWKVERSWTELHAADDLRGFLRAALAREEIMLRRERDLERFASCEPPPGTFSHQFDTDLELAPAAVEFLDDAE